MKLEVANKMSPQELCDYSVKAIVKQGCRAKNESGGCEYTTEDDNHCGIGQITDPKYHKSWEGRGILSLLDEDQGIVEGLPQPILDNPNLFSQLQCFHDSNQSSTRLGCAAILRDCYNIDTSGEHWQAWADLGNGG